MHLKVFINLCHNRYDRCSRKNYLNWDENDIFCLKSEVDFWLGLFPAIQNRWCRTHQNSIADTGGDGPFRIAHARNAALLWCNVYAWCSHRATKNEAHKLGIPERETKGTKIFNMGLLCQLQQVVGSCKKFPILHVRRSNMEMVIECILNLR